MLKTQVRLQKIGELAKSVGLSVSAVRYYEQMGIIRASRDPSSGYRVFAPGTDELLKLVIQAKEFGFTLEEIKAISKMLRNGDLTKEAVRQKLFKKLDDLEDKIRKIRTFQKNVRKVLASPCPNEFWLKPQR